MIPMFAAKQAATFDTKNAPCSEDILLQAPHLENPVWVVVR
jgi:hypothetical protein